MKFCTTCKTDKPRSGFNKNKTRSAGLQTKCRECQRASLRAYYASDRQKHMSDVKQRDRKRVIRTYEWLRTYLDAHPCVDCGESDPVVLDFDHVRGEKEFNVATMIRRAMPHARILAEIAKCEVRCANCHRRRTARVRGYLRFTLWSM